MANKDGFSGGLDQLDENMGQAGRMTAEFEKELARLRQSMAEAVWKRCPVVSFRKTAGDRDGGFHRRHRPGTGHAFP